MRSVKLAIMKEPVFVPNLCNFKKTLNNTNYPGMRITEEENGLKIEFKNECGTVPYACFSFILWGPELEEKRGPGRPKREE